MGVFSCGGVFVAMPCVALAGGLGIGIVCAVEDDKQKGVGAGCALIVGVRIGIPSRSGVSGVVPGIGLTGGCTYYIMAAVVDGEVKGIGAGTIGTIEV